MLDVRTTNNYDFFNSRLCLGYYTCTCQWSVTEIFHTTFFNEIKRYNGIEREQKENDFSREDK